MSKLKNRSYQHRSSAEWEAIFKKFEESNLSKTAFCKENGIKPTTFIEHFNRRKKKSKSMEDHFPDFIPVTVAAQSPEVTELYEQHISISIGKATIAIAPGFNPALLKSVASTLAELC